MGLRGLTAGVFGLISAVSLPLSGLAATELGQAPTDGSPIAFAVGADVSGGLAVEADGVDISDFATYSDGLVTLDPSVPLGGGVHVITVYALSDGRYEMLGEWTIETAAAPVLTSLTVSATHEAEVRRLNGEASTVARSFGEAEAELYDGRVTGRAAYVASSRDEEQPNGRSVDLEQYVLQFRHSAGIFDITAGLGHQDFDVDDVLVADLYRRGVRLGVETQDQRAAFGVFGAAATDLSGVTNITGVGEADNRIEGYYAAFRPFAESDLRLSVTGQSARGIAFGATDVGSGDGIGLALDGSAAGGRLRYALGAAQTDWDEDAEGAVFGAERGQALVASVEYDVADGGWNADDNRALTLGLLYERVDDSYMSLANPGLAVGQQRLRATADYYTDQLTLAFAAERQETNVNGPPTLETDEIYTLQLDGAYAPLSPVTSFGVPGTALWDFGVVYSFQNRLETPPMAADPADFASVELYAGYGRQFDYWSWRLGYSFIDFNDQSAFDEDTRSHRVDGTLDWSNGTGLSLSAYAAADFIGDGLGDYVDTQVTLTGTYDLSPGVWVLNGSLTQNAAQSAYGSDGLSVTADLVRAVSDNAELVASAGYSTDDLAAETPEDEEWFVGLLLRLRTDVFR